MARAAARMSIRIDRKVKAHSQQLFKSLGLDMTTAINIFLRQSLLHKGLPFEVTAGSADSAFMMKLAEIYLYEDLVYNEKILCKTIFILF